MNGQLIYALCCVALWFALSVLVWRNSPKFRSLYPRFQSGPFWAMLSISPMVLCPPAMMISNQLLGPLWGRDSWATLLIAGVPLVGGMILIDTLIPHTRRATIAYNQHLMGRPVTGRLLSAKSQGQD
jgi:hypothetical protein